MDSEKIFLICLILPSFIHLSNYTGKYILSQINGDYTII